MVEVKDGKQRPLVFFRENGQAVFYRYRDLAPIDREVALRIYDSVRAVEGAVSGTREEFENFLDFKSTGPDICG